MQIKQRSNEFILFSLKPKREYRSYSKIITSSILVTAFLFLTGCAAIYEEKSSYSGENNDESGLFYDTTGKNFSEIFNYKTIPVSKKNVFDAWGAPINIMVSSSNDSKAEYWSYEKKLSFSSIIVFPILIPIAVWPTGYYTTTVHIKDGYVLYVSESYGDFVMRPKIRLH